MSFHEREELGSGVMKQGQQDGGNILVGTCSWADRTLLGSGWYPKGLSDPSGRLKFYSGQFRTVEVDSTFYAIPDEATVYNWAARTPPDFRFNIKVFGLFTFHAVDYGSLPSWLRKELPLPHGSGRLKFSEIPRSLRMELWRYFEQAIKPLHQMGRMGYLLFQLPPWAGFSKRMTEYMRRVAEVATPFKVAVEVRNRTWLEGSNRDEFLDLLREFNLAYVIVDEPDLEWTVPPELLLTASWGSVVRFHGRNRESWSRRDVPVQERFRYLYSEEELIPWKNSLQEISSQVGQVYAMFNNCFRNYAVRNASQMRDLLGQKIPGGVERGVQQDLGLH